MRRDRRGNAVHDWHDLAPWSNSWDAADPEVSTYADSGVAWSIPAATRVASVPDRNGSRPMAKDTGYYGTTGAGFGGINAPVPGALWVPSSSRFANRPCWFSDRIMIIDTLFKNFHSMLTPCVTQSDVFGYAQPFWCALVAAPGEGTGNENTFTDGNPGYTTMSSNATITIATWNSFAATGPVIDTGLTPTNGKPTLVIWRVDGASSWCEVTRFTGGALSTARTTGSQGGVSLGLTTMHSGWSHMNYMTCIAIAQGVPSETDVTRVRSWASSVILTPSG